MADPVRNSGGILGIVGGKSHLPVHSLDSHSGAAGKEVPHMKQCRDKGAAQTEKEKGLCDLLRPVAHLILEKEEPAGQMDKTQPYCQKARHGTCAEGGVNPTVQPFSGGFGRPRSCGGGEFGSGGSRQKSA